MSGRDQSIALGSEGFPARFAGLVQRRGVRAFARAAELSEGVVRKYMNGESLPTLDRLEKIARAAEVSLAWLATGEVKFTGIEVDETSARIEALSRWLSVNVVALNMGLVSLHPAFAIHQSVVIPYVLSDVAFGSLLAGVFDEITQCNLWNVGAEKDKLIHEYVQTKLLKLYEQCVEGESLSPPWWAFAFHDAPQAGAGNNGGNKDAG
ncbi:helix-turn-helix domain-containing protein [Pseudomonas veronii]